MGGHSALITPSDDLGQAEGKSGKNSDGLCLLAPMIIQQLRAITCNIPLRG